MAQLSTVPVNGIVIDNSTKYNGIPIRWRRVSTHFNIYIADSVLFKSAMGDNNNFGQSALYNYLNGSFYHSFSEGFRNVISNTSMSYSIDDGNSPTVVGKVLLPPLSYKSFIQTSMLNTNKSLLGDSILLVATGDARVGSGSLVETITDDPNAQNYPYYGTYPYYARNPLHIVPIITLDPTVEVTLSNGIYYFNFNNVPSFGITSPSSNQTLYENGQLEIDGNVLETDINDTVTIKYQIDSGTVRNLHSAVSDGVTQIDFNKVLTYKGGMLHDGTLVVTSVLDKDVPHTVSMWAEDSKGGKSNIITRSFFVVPNRPPTITIAPNTTQSGMINSEVIHISGAVADQDNNEVTVTFSINGGEEQQVYNGPPSAFTFNILLANLKNGANTVIVKATDTYNMSGTKTLTIHKTHNAVPVNEAVARYQILAPTGHAKSVLLWIERTLGNLGIEAQVSLTDASEAESYVDLTKTNTGIKGTYHQDEFAYQGAVEKEKIILKITYTRTDADVTDVIKQISGVLF